MCSVRQWTSAICSHTWRVAKTILPALSDVNNAACAVLSVLTRLLRWQENHADG